MTLPKEVKSGERFLIEATAKEHSSVNVFVDVYQVGKMFWDAEKKLKYLSVSISIPGKRLVIFKVDGKVAHSQAIEVK